MSGESDQNIEPKWLRDLPLRSEEIGFSPDELVKCGGCDKANPPTRPSCLYCGMPLESVVISKLDIRAPESWENGFNVVVIDTKKADVDRAAVRLASATGAETEKLKAILTLGKIIPLSRVDSESQALAISEALVEFGVKTMIVADDSLRPASPPTRLRSIVFDGDELRLELFNIRETRSLKRDELALVVPGTILEERTESIEKRIRSRTKTLRETQLSFDEPVIDFYSRSDPTGWRIPARGFDFSCLGSDKSLIVAENMKKLISKLVEFSLSAKFVDEYVKVRAALEFAWPSETKRETHHLALGKKEVSNVLATNNSMQFTKYSRLQWQLYEKKV